MFSFKATEIFKIVLIEGKKYPLNINFKVVGREQEDAFSNSGLFTIHYKGELIYIGYSNTNSDIRTSRWVRQIATITLRGEDVCFSESASNALLQNDNLKFFFDSEIIQNDNVDFQTSINRVLFAAEHWNEFAVLSQNTLSHFIFNWYPNISTKSIIDLENLCNALKKQYKPRCNKEYETFKFDDFKT